MNETALQAVEIFRDLNVDELRHLADLFVEVSVPAGSVVFRRRHVAGAFYVIQEGRVALLVDVAGKRPQVMAELGPGECFGELGIHDELTGAVTARTRETSRVLEITKEDLLRFIEGHPSVALRLRTAARRPRPIRLGAPADERRRERIPVERTVVLMLGDSTSQLTRIENLTTDGLCLCGLPAAWDKSGMDVRFHLGIGTGLLQLGGRIIWLQEGRAGIQFTQKSRSHATKIQWALRQLLEDEEGDEPSSRPRSALRSSSVVSYPCRPSTPLPPPTRVAASPPSRANRATPRSVCRDEPGRRR